MTTLTINIITIIAEVLLVFIFFFLVNWSFGKVYRKIIRLPLLNTFESSAPTIRRNVRRFIFLVSFLLSLAILGLNGYLVYKGENVRDYSLQLFRKIPQEFWITLSWGIIKSIGVIIALAIILKIFNPLLDKLSQYVQDFDEITDNDLSIATFFKALKKNINNASWIAIAILCAEFLILPPIVSKYLYILLRIYLIISVGLLFFKVIAVIIDSLDALTLKYSSSNNLLRFYKQLRHLISFLKRCLEYITYVFMATLVVQQIDFIANLATWGAVGIKLISILLISRILISVAYLLVEELLLNVDNLTEVQQQRRQTITPLIQSITKYMIYFGAGILMLDSIGVDPGPILAGAGILGLAVGLGAQNLINDIVSGFFILFENYYLVGDYIETDDASGYVEAIELRTTRIRHCLGQVYIIRNGDITSITNFSKDFVYAHVEVGVDYGTNLAFIQEIIEKVGRQLQAENDDILEPTQVDGIKEFGDIRLSIFTVTKVKPGRHIHIQRILRQVLKEVFDREGIYIPLGESSDKPDWVAKVQQEQNKQYKNVTSKIRKVLDEPETMNQIQPVPDKKYKSNQLQNKSTINQSIPEAQILREPSLPPTDSQQETTLTLDTSVEEAAQIFEKASQKAIVHQPEDNLTPYETVLENQISQETSKQSVTNKSQERSIVDKSVKLTQIQQDEAKQEKSNQPKTLKKMLKEFLDTH